MPNQLRNHFCSLMDLRKGMKDCKYLGLPLYIQRARTKSFSPILERVQSRLSSWQSKILSQAARGVLIRTVAATLPSYCMSSFLLPKAITSKLDSLFSNFWWGSTPSGHSRMHLKSWDSICLPKQAGGLGFKKMHEQNLALLSKQTWELINASQKPHHQLLKAKYLKQHPFLSHTPKQKSSYFWQGLCKTRDLLSKGVVFRIGNGLSIDIWKDPWVPNLPNHLPQPAPVPNSSSSQHFNVSQLLNSDASWNIQLLNHLFHPSTIPHILSIQLPPQPFPDKLIWSPNSNGLYSVKSAYNLARTSSHTQHASSQFNWKGLWRSQIHDRHKLLMWKLIWNIIPTGAVIESRMHVENSICLFCFSNSETVDHLMLHCSFSSIVWSRLHWPLNFEADSTLTLKDWICKVLICPETLQHSREDQHSLQLQMVIAFDYLWQLRNSNRERMELLDPIAAASEINRRHKSATNAWVLRKVSPHDSTSTARPSYHMLFSTDVAFHDGEAWLGIVCTSPEGSLISAWSYKSAAVAPQPGELDGIGKAIALAKGLKISHLYLSSDAKDVVELLQSATADTPPHLAASIAELLLQLASFCSWNICYIPRSSNFLAHNIAKWASRSSYHGPINLSDIPSRLLLRVMEM